MYRSNNDLPTTDDLSLGTSYFVEKMALDIQHSMPPKTFAITGYWGSGKTSALAMLFKKLTNTSPFETTSIGDDNSADCIGIWFEAWRYQHEALPVVALLQEIKKSFSISDKFINKAGKLASVSFLGALTVLDGVIKSAVGISGLSKVKGIGEAYEKENLLSRLSSDHINDALEKAIDTLLNNEPADNKKLVIFIDDLDRCEPEMAITLLEGLKLYLNVPNCIVIMAIDSHQIESNILKRIDELDCNNRFQGVEYMEKLCQDSYRLPVPDSDQRNKFLMAHLTPLLSDLGHEELVVTRDLEDAIRGHDCLPANPRRLKMLANRIASVFRHVKVSDISIISEYCTANSISDNSRDELFAIGVLIVSSLSVNYRRLYERLEKSSLFTSELFEFSNIPSSQDYNEKKSVFYEFNNISASTRKVVDHPSDLGVFRLAALFGDAANSIIGKYNVDKIFYGDMLHHIIKSYNSPRV